MRPESPTYMPKIVLCTWVVLVIPFPSASQLPLNSFSSTMEDLCQRQRHFSGRLHLQLPRVDAAVGCRIGWVDLSGFWVGFWVILRHTKMISQVPLESDKCACIVSAVGCIVDCICCAFICRLAPPLSFVGQQGAGTTMTMTPPPTPLPLPRPQCLLLLSPQSESLLLSILQCSQGYGIGIFGDFWGILQRLPCVPLV